MFTSESYQIWNKCKPQYARIILNRRVKFAQGNFAQETWHHYRELGRLCILQ